MEQVQLSKAVLVAVRPQDLDIVANAIGTEFKVMVCHTLECAVANLAKNIGLIACGVHFDDGAMFDLLRAAKANSNTQSVPFFLLIGEGEHYSKAILDGIHTAAKVLGAVGLTDLSRLKTDLGEQEAYERLRQVIRQTLSDSGSTARDH